MVPSDHLLKEIAVGGEPNFTVQQCTEQNAVQIHMYMDV